MEGGGVAEKRQQTSYSCWVRKAREDAAPLPVPRKLSVDDMSKQPKPSTLGSVWNQVGTWEERNLNSWASNRIKELLSSLGSLEFSSGNAYIEEVSECSGDIEIQRLSEEKGLPTEDKMQICKDLRLFLRPMGERLLKFEQELEYR